MFGCAGEAFGNVAVRSTSDGPLLPESLKAQNIRERQAVSKYSRRELEDKYFLLLNENLTLKQQAHKQEDKIRRMVVKLLRLQKDNKWAKQAIPGVPAEDKQDAPGMEEMMEALKQRVQEQDRHKEEMRQHFLAVKQQLQSRTSRHTPYSNVPPRVCSGLNRPSSQRIAKEDVWHVDGGVKAKPFQDLLLHFGQSLLEEAHADIRNLENVIESQQTQMQEMDRSAEELRSLLKIKEREFEESSLQNRVQQGNKQRLIIKDNVEMIKVQKQLEGKENALKLLEDRFLQQLESLKTLKVGYEAAMMKVDELSKRLKEERQSKLELEMKVQSSSREQNFTRELQDRIDDLETERDLLKKTCNTFVKSTFDVSQEQKWKVREQQLKLQITQLEAALRLDLTEKNQIQDQIKEERELSDNLTKENQQLKTNYVTQKKELEELQERVKLFSKESEVDPAELGEALLFIKKRKSQTQNAEPSPEQLQVTHAETIQELEKTRNMLLLQHKINKDYQTEVAACTVSMEDLKSEYELKLADLSRLLDLQSAKTRKLEAQLKGVAYGGETHLRQSDLPSDETLDRSLVLSDGENLLEIHLGQAKFSSLPENDPRTFCTYAFYDFELQSTAVVPGVCPHYDFTSQYMLRVDELLLNYLHSASITVELQLANDLTFHTIAGGRLRLNQLLEQDGKVCGTIRLFAVGDEMEMLGTVDYWLKLKIPIQRDSRLYKERFKKLRHTTSPAEDSRAASVLASDAVMEGALNELQVTVHSCRGLTCRSPGRRPSAYVVYKFHTCTDRYTPTVPSSSSPHFEDHRVFLLPMNSDLHAFLTSESLLLYVFDDLDSADSLYLGRARVPLVSLSRDQTITGTFELSDPEGRPSGEISLTMKWKFSYSPPTSWSVTPNRPTLLTSCQDQKGAGDPVASAPPSSSLEVAVLKPNNKVPPLSQKRVSFAGFAEPEIQTAATHSATVSEEEEEEDEEEEKSEVSPAPGVTGSSQSEESEVSEELHIPETEAGVDGEDSDDCILPSQRTPRNTSSSSCIRVEIVSLTLTPGSRVATDHSVVRLFVEYSFLGLPLVETPLSLKKPLPGRHVFYNFSNVIRVDAENNQATRQTLRTVLRGQNTRLQNMRFTVVSDPPEEDEQEKECEDLGVASVCVADILERREDLKNVPLDIMDVKGGSDVIGHLVVTVEALEAFVSVMEDPTSAS